MVEVQRPVQPDIQYHPDYAKYTARTQHRIATETLPTTLPLGFPSHLDSPLVWEGSEIEQRDDWIYRLNDAQLDEIDQALNTSNVPLLLLLLLLPPLPTAY